MDPSRFDILNDRRVQPVLARLYAQASRQTAGPLAHYLPKLPRVLLGQKLNWNSTDGFYDDKYIALEPDQGALCYLLARSLNACRIVEFGTSFGISTIWLAAAVRENGAGKVIGTEIVPGKAAQACRTFARRDSATMSRSALATRRKPCRS